MGTFTFTWPHTAEDVFVTGTFDNWSKSEKLEKFGEVFEKKVTLPNATEKIYYKFVVDNTWTTNPDAPRETDREGNENNVLKPEDIEKSAAAIMSTVGPESTTAQLAGAVPLEKKEEPAVPGGFPETPAAELDKEVKVSPLPAAEGAVNPIKLAPGEPVPDISSDVINNHVTLDKDSYEKSDRIPGLPGIDALPPVSANLIPESSLPISGPGEVTINSVSAESTTAQLAGQVPLENKVPEVVKESQEQAKADPEASGVAEEVKEKAQVEEELLQKVPEAPSTSEGTAGQGTEKSEGDRTTAAVAAAAAGAAAVETGLIAQESLTSAATGVAKKLPEPVKDAVPASVKEANATESKETSLETVSPEVPSEVKESIAEAGKSPDAAANTTAVQEKKEVEAELLKEVKPTEPIGEPSTKAKTNGKEAPAPAAPETPSKSAPAPAENVTPSSSKPAESPAGTEKKKKNRLSVSALFSKFKPGKKDKA